MGGERDHSIFHCADLDRHGQLPLFVIPAQAGTHWEGNAIIPSFIVPISTGMANCPSSSFPRRREPIPYWERGRPARIRIPARKPPGCST